VRGGCPAALLLLAFASALSAQSHATREADVRMGRSWIEVQFPALELAQTGCESTRALPTGEIVRWYQWHVAADFPDQAYPNNHFLSLYVLFELPDAVPLTEARLDSALASARITLDEARGEPPLAGTSTRPRSAHARREGKRVRLRVEDGAATRAFRATRADSVSVGWCERGQIVSALTVPLKRQK
jgi:hypothetical protein